MPTSDALLADSLHHNSPRLTRLYSARCSPPLTSFPMQAGPTHFMAPSARSAAICRSLGSRGRRRGYKHSPTGSRGRSSSSSRRCSPSRLSSLCVPCLPRTRSRAGKRSWPSSYRFSIEARCPLRQIKAALRTCPSFGRKRTTRRRLRAGDYTGEAADVGRLHAGHRDRLLRAGGGLRVGLRPALKGNDHDHRLCARDSRYSRAARLPDLCPAEARAVLRSTQP
jgi:hypothetical protein